MMLACELNEHFFFKLSTRKMPQSGGIQSKQNFVLRQFGLFWRSHTRNGRAVRHVSLLRSGIRGAFRHKLERSGHIQLVRCDVF